MQSAMPVRVTLLRTRWMFSVVFLLPWKTLRSLSNMVRSSSLDCTNDILRMGQSIILRILEVFLFLNLDPRSLNPGKNNFIYFARNNSVDISCASSSFGTTSPPIMLGKTAGHVQTEFACSTFADMSLAYWKITLITTCEKVSKRQYNQNSACGALPGCRVCACTSASQSPLQSVLQKITCSVTRTMTLSSKRTDERF